MRKRIFLFVLAVLFIAGVAWAANESPDTVTVRLLNRIEVNKSKDAKAAFEGLTPQAAQIGFADALLLGRLSFQTLPDKRVRVKVEWHSIGTQRGEAVEALDSPLWSQFLIDQGKIEPGERLTARGNLEDTTAKFLALQEKLKSGASPKHLVDSKETTREKTNVAGTDSSSSRSGDLSPSASTSGSGFDSGSSTNNSSENVTTSLITTRQDPCAPRVAPSENLVYLQAKQVKVDSSGVIVETGACADTGETVIGTRVYNCPPIIDSAAGEIRQSFTTVAEVNGNAITIQECTVDPDRTVPGIRDYAGCEVLPDFGAGKVFNQFRLIGDLNGTIREIKSCERDQDSFFLIESDSNVCGARHDFTNNVSIQTAKLFYTDDSGTNQYLTECQDTTTTYPHFQTETTCTPTIDSVANVVILNMRTAYNLPNGTVEFATDCRPVSSGGLPIYEEFCSPKYEHDFVNNQSYYRTKDYYLDETGSPKYITACSKSPQVSFSHTFDTTGCGLVNDDVNLKTQFKSRTIIDTPDDGILEISPCQERGAPISYAYTGDEVINHTDILFPPATNGTSRIFPVWKGRDIIRGEANLTGELSSISFTANGPIFEYIGALNVDGYWYQGPNGVTDAAISTNSFTDILNPNTMTLDTEFKFVSTYRYGWMGQVDTNNYGLKVSEVQHLRNYIRGDFTVFKKDLGSSFSFSGYATGQ